MEKDQTLRRTQTRNQPSPGEEAFAKIVESKEEVNALRKLLKEIMEGPAFKGSQRSGQFLEFVVEQSLAGNFDHLKERMIGVELFKRQPSYDTGEDAIVRVTASDVRKRLLQHYGWFGNDCEYRIDLPLGSYIPRVSRTSQAEEDDTRLLLGRSLKMEAVPADAAAPEQEIRTLSPEVASAHLPVVSLAEKKRAAWSFWRTAAVLVLAVSFGWWLKTVSRSAPSSALSPVLLWSALFNPSASTHLITSDPNIDTVQGISKTSLSLSDYANHKYLPEPSTLTPEQLRFSKILLFADTSAATPDVPIAARVSAIAQTFSRKLQVQTSRSFQLSSLSNNDNFVFLGSPRSNPWFSLFAGALGFQFVYNPALGSEFIRNLHPHRSEEATYVPSANGGGTGYSFAVVAFVQNPDQNGEVLLIAGADGEATSAAGDLVTDLPRISRALHNCGIEATGTNRHFEVLLRTDTMAGVSRGTEIVACHKLVNAPSPAAPNPSKF